MGSFSSALSQTTANMIKIVVLLSVVGLALAAPAVQPYILPYHGAVLPYSGLPILYAPAAPLDSGLVYPVAEAYVHDTSGDESDDSYPAAEAYVHDTTGDA